MKTFKEYLVQTSFGEHSKPKNVHRNIIWCQIRSDKSEFLDESLEAGIDQISSEEEKKIHLAHSAEFHPVINDYTDDSYEINSNLHLKHLDDDHIISKRIITNVMILDEIISKHKTKHDMTVYAGVDSHKFGITNYITNKSAIVHPAFLSTSTNFLEARRFSPINTDENHRKLIENYVAKTGYAKNAKLDFSKGIKHVLKIFLKSGTHAISVRNQSASPSENEILIHRNSKLRINKKPEIHISPTGCATMIWNTNLE